MKRCPTCNKTFTDPNLVFCVDDGTPLASVAETEDEITIVSPTAGEPSGNPPPTQVYKPRDWQAPDYQPPDYRGPATGGPKSKTWFWIVAILAVVFAGLVGLGFAVAILIPNMMRAANKNSENTNVERRNDYNSNRNSNSTGSNQTNQDDNDNTSSETDEDVTTPPPTDEEKVLADLTQLEHEWTVANINADKKKLDRILADDYVGMSSEGNSQGKAEYISGIERDTSIQRWDFEDLKVNLKGTRASLTGVIRLHLNNQEAAYKFTDTFVWRDGRWQAVGSDVSRIQ
ncbi:MAG: DUF4440 domain-containing protein [Pyrinomonadaceae bacterium]